MGGDYYYGDYDDYGDEDYYEQQAATSKKKSKKNKKNPVASEEDIQELFLKFNKFFTEAQIRGTLEASRMDNDNTKLDKQKAIKDLTFKYEKAQAKNGGVNLKAAKHDKIQKQIEEEEKKKDFKEEELK
eukprot:CAMPEP_0202961186 /NCGR_PEP_ID=MMETSP1396-20130829/5241_1 /ASSEMBLY_ACC=CAM_ASM_000872 /TAXON_ID= /ORGANISM="Pseudokeronopsis sp., Strain Brazil" /LENGTH=128 /DNA_ID=CAMNT_0049680825 /DNA_START=43 /DNA_END=429 /DNA_ORIENTATION=-